MLLSKAAPPGHSMIFLWNHYPHTISSWTGRKVSVFLICIFICIAPHIGIFNSHAHFLVGCLKKPTYRKQILFEKKKRKSSKKPSIFFKKYYNTKTSNPNRFLKNFSGRVASDRKPSMYFFLML